MGSLLLYVLIFFFWSSVLFLISKYDEDQDPIDDDDDRFDPKENQTVAQTYYRGITRADLERMADSRGIKYSVEDSYVQLKEKLSGIIK